MVKGLFCTGQQIPLTVSVAKNGNTPVTDSLAAGQESLFQSQGFGELDGSSVLVLNSGPCYMTCPGVLLLLPGWDACPLQVTPRHFPGCPNNWLGPFTTPGGDSHFENSAFPMSTT